MIGQIKTLLRAYPICYGLNQNVRFLT